MADVYGWTFDFIGSLSRREVQFAIEKARLKQPRLVQAPQAEEAPVENFSDDDDQAIAEALQAAQAEGVQSIRNRMRT